MMALRTYRPEDLPHVLRAAYRTAQAQLSHRERAIADPAGVCGRIDEMYQRALGQGGGTLMVADDGGVLAGYLLLGIEFAPSANRLEATVLDVWVAPARRGCGLAGALHAAAVDLARSAGAGVLRAMIAAGNGASLQAHTKSGFGAEALLMGKPL